METLVTGHIDILSQAFLDHLGKQTDLILSTDQDIPTFSGSHLTQYRQSIRDNDFLNLFSSYSFDAVIYFLSRPETSVKSSYEMEDLERVMSACAQKPIKKVIVVSSTYVYKGRKGAAEEERLQPSDSVNLHLSAVEELCRTYRETYHVPITVLRTACLYGEEESVSYIGANMKKLLENDTLVLEGRADQVVEFLSIRDLGKLLERMLMEPQKIVPVMNVPGFTRLSLMQFADMLKQLKPGASIRFTGKPLAAGPPVHSQLAHKEYRWGPAVDLREEAEKLFDSLNRKFARPHRSLFARIRDFYRAHASILIALELILGFFLMEYLIDFSEATVQFRVIDFRLLYVVLFAGAHGPQIGLIAALAASISTYTSYMALGVNWRIIFYNVDNWIPFAVYFITAWILGYVHDRYRRDLTDTKEEIDELEKKHALLNDLYMRSLERKAAYEKQIISYSDSFGKTYRFFERLEKADSSRYFEEVLEAVEDFLDNETVSIYVFSEQDQTAYRYIFSNKAADVAPEVLTLDEYPELSERLQKEEVWVNKNQVKGYPDYALPIHKGEDLVVLITIHEAAFEQMNLQFENLFKITGYFVSVPFSQKLETAGETLLKPLRQSVEKEPPREKSDTAQQVNHLHVIAPKRKLENE